LGSHTAKDPEVAKKEANLKACTVTSDSKLRAHYTNAEMREEIMYCNEKNDAKYKQKVSGSSAERSVNLKRARQALKKKNPNWSNERKEELERELEQYKSQKKRAFDPRRETELQDPFFTFAGTSVRAEYEQIRYSFPCRANVDDAERMPPPQRQEAVTAVPET
jgi:hypothetical protein